MEKAQRASPEDYVEGCHSCEAARQRGLEEARKRFVNHCVREAAPDLLAACQEAVKRIKFWPKAPKDLFLLLNTAIAKATP